MVDSGATTTFLSRQFVKENRVVAMAGYTYLQQLAEQEYKQKEVRSVEEMVPPEY